MVDDGSNFTLDSIESRVCTCMLASAVGLEREDNIKGKRTPESFQPACKFLNFVLVEDKFYSMTGTLP